MTATTEHRPLHLEGGPYERVAPPALACTVARLAAPFFCYRRDEGEWHRYVIGNNLFTYEWDGPCRSRHHEYGVEDA